ncbi:hypothetical protein BH10PAT3_BH10PAT3_7990 [soil metagenome]
MSATPMLRVMSTSRTNGINEGGYTVLELLVVLLIVCILAALIFWL